MFICIPKHLSNIEIISEMTELLRGYINEYGLNNYKSFDYYYYYYTIDPVKNFIRMCLYDGDVLDEGILWYLIKLFYSVKGTPKVLDLMESKLKLKFIPDSSGKKYNYSDTKISYQLEDIQTFNLNSFLEAQEKFLGALLYYSDLESFIKVARLHIEENLGSDLSLINWNYTKYEV